MFLIKTYNEDKEREIWNKQKLMGERKFIASTTLQFTVGVLTPLSILYILSNYFFGAPSYSPLKLFLISVTYAIILILIGLKISSGVWVSRTIKFDGITGIVTEIDDCELKNLILKGEKIMAAKRYRIITGAKLIESIRYVDYISKYYSEKN